MADHINIQPAEGTWVVRAGGAVIGESDNALKLTEGDYPYVIYFPKSDIAMEFLDRSDHVTTCKWKGDSSHYSIVTKSTVLENAAWSYEDPKPEVASIKDYIAFYASDTVAIEQV